MNIAAFSDYCLAKYGVTEEQPFGPDVLVYKVLGKVFALVSLDTEVFQVNLKCDPELAIELRESYQNVVPGYHMNKKHWNTVVIGHDVTTTLIKQWTDHSYDLVYAALPAKLKTQSPA